jgi:hypothetical protein
MVSGKLYTGWSDATFTVRDFDGTTMGAPSTINLNGLEVQPPTGFNIPGTSTRVPAFTTDLQNMTGMFYANGRIYYTVNRPGSGSTNLANDNKLYYRYFTPESQVVGANLFVASSYPTDTSIQWVNVRGMTLANGKLIYATSDNRLWRVDWSGTGPVGTPTQIGGPGIDAAAWASRGLFVFNQTVDGFAPAVPVAPTGSSSTFDSIDLSWPAVTDNLPGDLTYHVFRDGSEVGQVTGAQSGTIAFTDTGLAAGSTHAYRIAAQDAVGNQSAQGPASASIEVLAPDETPPTDPGTPTGVSGSTASIALSWAASTDAVSSTLTYRVYRDAPDQLVGTVVSSSTGTVGFTDTGLWPGTTHEYWVEALDEAENVSGQAHSDPIPVTPAAFADDFAGGLATWTTVTRISVDVASGSAAAPSAQGNPTAQSAFAYVDLASPLAAGCVSANVNVSARSGITLDLLRLRSAGGGALAKVYLDTQGRLLVRSEFSSTQISSGVVLPSGWNRLELCGTVGTLGAWNLYLNGAPIVTGWQANTGTNPIARLQIGDTAAKTWTANWDDVIVDTAAG